MTDEQIIRLIAEDREWKWINYLDADDPGPAHELIEVLRAEGWRACIIAHRQSGWSVLFDDKMKDFDAKSPTFCRAVAEAFLKVRGKWVD